MFEGFWQYPEAKSLGRFGELLSESSVVWWSVTFERLTAGIVTHSF